jgi:3-isopropylmalate dehydratase small subunit
LIECPSAIEAYSEGSEIKIDIENGKISVGNKIFSYPKLPKEILEIRNAGGLLEYTRSKLKNKYKK